MVDGRGVGDRPARGCGVGGRAGVAALGLLRVGGGDMGVVGGGRRRRRAGRRASGEGGCVLRAADEMPTPPMRRRRFLFRVCHRDTGFLRCVTLYLAIRMTFGISLGV